MTDIHASARPKTRWLSAFFNPTGTSPKLEFTRGWTLLFFLQLLIILGPWFLALIIGTVGGDGTLIRKFGIYGSALVFILTTVMSFVLHSRRLRDAGRTSLWAIIILLPLFLALAFFTLSVMSSAQQYDKMYAERVAYVENPQAFEEKKAEEARQKAKEKRDEAIAACEARRLKAAEADKEIDTTKSCAQEAEDAANARRGGGNWGGNSDPAYKSSTPPQLGYVLEPNLPTIQYVIILLTIFIAIWSLMWVARVPHFGRSKLEEDEAFGKVGR